MAVSIGLQSVFVHWEKSRHKVGSPENRKKERRKFCSRRKEATSSLLTFLSSGSRALRNFVGGTY